MTRTRDADLNRSPPPPQHGQFHESVEQQPAGARAAPTSRTGEAHRITVAPSEVCKWNSMATFPGCLTKPSVARREALAWRYKAAARQSVAAIRYQNGSRR
jgi:hypothetical protein